MGRSVADWVKYIPEAFENRADPEPVSLEILPLTGKELQQLKRIDAMNDGDKVSTLADQLVATNVRNITNYSARGARIVTGQDLLDRGELQIIAEVVGALIKASTLGPDSLGKSEPPSVSQQTPAAQQAGAALDASAPSNQILTKPNGAGSVTATLNPTQTLHFDGAPGPN
jgi:hypothetical protein